MNIHITDNNLFNTLKKNSLISMEVGSAMYGISDILSDKDFLSVYLTSKSELYSVSFSHHQIQYKDSINNIDFNFVSIHSFIRNLLSGDSTINFEMINTQSLLNNDFRFLYDNRLKFFTYNVIRSYCGLARRDVNEISSLSNERDKNKKLLHSYRGYEFAKSILDKSFSIDTISNELREKLIEIKSFNENDRINLSIELKSKIEELRRDINTKLDKKEIIRYIDSKFQRELDEWVISLFKEQELIEFDLDLFYNVNEKGIIY